MNAAKIATSPEIEVMMIATMKYQGAHVDVTPGDPMKMKMPLV